MNFVDIILGALPYVLGIGIIGTVIGVLLNFLKEVSDVLIAVVSALEDKNLTKEEIANIVVQAKEVVEAAKKFATIGKK